MVDRFHINTTIIPPQSDVGPFTKIEQFEDEYRMTVGYTESAINEMIRRANENLDEELMARLARQHGYVKPVYCRDCKHFEDYLSGGMCYQPDGNGGYANWATNPDDYCSSGKPRVEPCRNTDEKKPCEVSQPLHRKAE